MCVINPFIHMKNNTYFYIIFFIYFNPTQSFSTCKIFTSVFKFSLIISFMQSINKFYDLTLLVLLVCSDGLLYSSILNDKVTIFRADIEL